MRRRLDVAPVSIPPSQLGDQRLHVRGRPLLVLVRINHLAWTPDMPMGLFHLLWLAWKLPPRYLLCELYDFFLAWGS
jgi:hypothetical protein